MAQRIVRNDFVAGEIDPALWGRHDVEMFFHGAARVENFVPRKTGGLRKRAGTELVWMMEEGEGHAIDARIVPYRFDKDEFGLLALYRKSGAAQVFWRLWSSRTQTATAEAAVPFLSVTASTPLSDIRHEQIGDTIYFTLRGRRAFTAKVTFVTRTVEWAQLSTSVTVAAPPALATTASGFRNEEGYVASTRTYALWGVRNGIRSAPQTKTQNMTLAWVAGAYIDVTFTPNWAAHDYYILGKLQGGTYGEVARFYRDGNSGTRADTGSIYGGTQSATGEIDGETYTAAGGDIHSLWVSTDANAENAAGIHTAGAWVESVGIQHRTATAVALGIKAWFGAKMLDGNDAVASVGWPDTVHAVLYRTSGAGEIVAEWDVAPGYQEAETVLAIENPVANAGGFALHFYSSWTSRSVNTPVSVPMRGLALCSDVGTKKFHDDNISPGTLVGEQELLKVGFGGMDVDLVTTWQQRLVAAGAEQSPFTLWFSAVGDLYNFYVDRPQVADNAFEATIASTDANRILHIVSQKWLLAFTESGEFVIDGVGGSFAFNTISVKKTSSVGAHPKVGPTVTESDVLFVAADGRSVYKMDYSLERDSVVPSSVSTRAQHITELHRIRKIAYQRYPDSVLWCLLDDGSLASMTFVPEENVCGWARHTLAGGAGLKAVDIFATGSIRADADTDTTSDIMLVLEDEGKPGDVWVERLRPCVVSDSPAATHAECADHMGYAAADYPSGGDPKGEVQARLVTMRMEPQQGDMIGKQTNAFDTVLRIRRSGLVAVRPDKSELPWSGTVTQPDAQPVESGTTVALVEKDVKIAPRAFQNRDARLEIKSADQWPCELLSLCAMMEFGNMKWGG
jgi:hypothetical protein